MLPSAPNEAGPAKDHLLVVADGGRLAGEMRRRYPEWEVTSAQTYFMFSPIMMSTTRER